MWTSFHEHNPKGLLLKEGFDDALDLSAGEPEGPIATHCPRGVPCASLRSAFSCSFCWRFVGFFGIPASQETSGGGVRRARFLEGTVASARGRVSSVSVALGSFWPRGAGGVRRPAGNISSLFKRKNRFFYAFISFYLFLWNLYRLLCDYCTISQVFICSTTNTVYVFFI